jgi:peptidoglycan/xylan/chitin deacetylase (PgdA/CDA1 family)
MHMSAYPLRAFIRNSFLSVVFSLGPGLGSRASILMYHSVSRNGRFFTVLPDEFEWQMSYLKRKHFSVVPLRQLVEELRSSQMPPNGQVALTIDDGYADNFENVFPILKKFNFPATIFLTTDSIGSHAEFLRGEKLAMLSHAQITEMKESGLIDFMPHSATHRNLDTLSLQEAQEDIERSRQAIERWGGTGADIFAYPRGRYTPELKGYLEHSGRWRAALTVRPGLVHTDSSLFELPRNPVDSETTRRAFRAYFSRAIDLYEVIKFRLS